MLFGITYLLLYVFQVVFAEIRAENNVETESSFTPSHINHMKNETRQLFKHAWSSYMEYGFPFDEVRPRSCEPYGPDYNDVFNTVRNDAMGNISLTLLDNLDTLIIFGEWEELEKALTYLKTEKDVIFAKDTIVQVFETTIRALGGLLSSHVLLTDLFSQKKRIPAKYTALKQICDNYDGFLLDMAHDLGKRLVVAFDTKSNLPIPRVNLASGWKKIPSQLKKETCTSGAMSPILEFSLLSKLTGDPQFEHFTQLTFSKLWSSRLTLNLLPMTIDPKKNLWLDSITGIGASVDSFYEYAAKHSIIFNDDYMWNVFSSSYKSLLSHLAQGGGDTDYELIFSNVNVNDGLIATSWIDLLGAFFPGLQVLTGQVKDAVKTHATYLKLWDYFDLIPERWEFITVGKVNDYEDNEYKSILLEWYPLRPEFIESTYYLYRATRDPMYLQIGSRILELLSTKYKAKCGFNGIQDIRSGEFQNRMETFVMGETLKYLYLLFDVDNDEFLHSDLMLEKGWVFSTEAHPMWFNKRLLPDESTRSKYVSLSDKTKYTGAEVFHRSSLVPDTGNSLPKNKNYDKLFTKNHFKTRFSQCEATARQPESSGLLASLFYKSDNLFHFDHKFSKHLVRPHYLPQTHLDGSYIELSRPFFDTYGLATPQKGHHHFQSSRPPSTASYDIILGNVSEMDGAEISEIYNTHNSHPITNLHLNKTITSGDLWVPDLSSLRFKVERLAHGNIDTTNLLIDESHVLSITQRGILNCCRINDDELLRILKVNGVPLSPGAVIWTRPFSIQCPKDGSSPALDITDEGRLVIYGTIVENMHVLPQ